MDSEKAAEAAAETPPVIDRAIADAFLAELRKAPNVSAACRAAGKGRSTLYEWREKSPEFAAEWQEAIDEGIDDLVGECFRRARNGTIRPVFFQGVECGGVTEYSDLLAIFLLKAHRPATYRERVALTGENGGPIGVKQYQPIIEVTAMCSSVEEWERQIAMEDEARANVAAKQEQA